MLYEMKTPAEIQVYTMLTAIFTGLLVVANVLAVKPLAVGSTVVPAAVLTYALTFAITDTVNEIWGPRASGRLVTAGLIVSVLVALFISLAVALPAADDWNGHDAFRMILGQNGRIVLASMIAYVASQFHDVWAFDFWRRRTEGRHLWLRNNASTIVSQLIDSALFITVAFYGVWGGFDVIGPAILAQFAVKVIVAVADTPLVYFGVWWTRRFVGGSRRTGVEFV